MSPLVFTTHHPRDTTTSLLNVRLNHDIAISASDGDSTSSRALLLAALSRLAKSRDTETGSHPQRVGRYSRFLATEAAATSAFADQIDATFLELIDDCAPLHDIGKVGLPDAILLKPGKFEPEERLLMQTHTIIGSETLNDVARQFGSAVDFLTLAAGIARHHHEWYDGTGYPDCLHGNGIPLAARIVAIGDVYDALRSQRPYKSAFSHTTTLQIMTTTSHGQFDPSLFRIFQANANQFERIWDEFAE